MRRSIERLVIDWAPVKPSISGSMMSGTRSPPMGRLALEKRVLAALSSACSKAMGVGGGAGGGVGACASAGESDQAGGEQQGRRHTWRRIAK